jgi:hypothetical protein
MPVHPWTPRLVASEQLQLLPAITGIVVAKTRKAVASGSTFNVHPTCGHRSSNNQLEFVHFLNQDNAVDGANGAQPARIRII